MTWLSRVIDHLRAAAVRAHLRDVMASTSAVTATPERTAPAPTGRPVLPAVAAAGPAPTGGVASMYSLPAGLPRLPGSAGPERVPPRAPVRAGSNVSP